MLRSPIFAEQFADPSVAAALREHREDRAALLHSLTSSFEADPRIRVAWLWGSFGREDADDLSDLDPWLIVADEFAADMGPSVRHYAEEAGGFISGKEAPQNAPLGGGYFGALHEGRHGLLHIDCYWQPQSSLLSVVEHAVLFDRLHEPIGLMPTMFSKPSTASIDGGIASGLGFAWLMFSIAAKYLARDPFSDMGLIFYPREGLEKAIVLLGQQNTLPPLDWSVPQVPLAKAARLRMLVEATSLATAAANAQGLLLPSRYGPCLLRYLDMVEGILGYYNFGR